MDFVECFRLLAGRPREEIIVTSAGNCSELWWEITRESERVFYLDASMSLASLFAAGIALGNSRTVVALSGDGRLLASGGFDGTVKLWEVTSGTCLRTMWGNRRYEGLDITDLTGVTEAQKATLFALGAIERPPTQHA